jgi:hypothetical protein
LLHRHCTGQAAGTGGKIMSYEQQRDGYFYEVKDGMCVGRPYTQQEVPAFRVSYSFLNPDGDRVLSTQTESRDGLASIINLIAAKDRMAYQIHSIEAL